MSARNQIRGTVTSVTAGESATTVKLDAEGIALVASITTEAARDLNLRQGSEVTAIIKASDVILAIGD
ncbi:TOBE domain-containing protein [Allosalinactinospora lopnorensis]|uniref:TOBE domain-containing protein n=1 Tax=Allosalinactinospora lopnorensis TaxID=1352348 RepID=UPI00191BD67E|nr:TOBE domain-containing protein [Allosalinactinospora lopnorensis]